MTLWIWRYNLAKALGWNKNYVKGHWLIALLHSTTGQKHPIYNNVIVYYKVRSRLNSIESVRIEEKGWVGEGHRDKGSWRHMCKTDLFSLLNVREGREKISKNTLVRMEGIVTLTDGLHIQVLWFWGRLDICCTIVFLSLQLPIIAEHLFRRIRSTDFMFFYGVI